MEQSNKAVINQRLERISWALFLISVGGYALVPGDVVPEGAWLAGVGVIMLGLNMARYQSGIPISILTAVLGLIALALGLSNLLGVGMPILPILLIVIGINLLLKALAGKS